MGRMISYGTLYDYPTSHNKTKKHTYFLFKPEDMIVFIINAYVIVF